MIPKFRAWDKSLKEMTTVIAIVFENDIVKVRYDNRNMSSDSIENYILMQSTGLFDKNGVEIFEGDVVMWVRDESELVGVVAYDNKLGFWGMTDKRFKADDLTAIGYIANQNVEVIGNIYENPELVEAENE